MATATSSTITGATLREWLDERGIRYVWAARQMGITQSHLNFVMRGDRPLTSENARKLIDAYLKLSQSVIA